MDATALLALLGPIAVALLGALAWVVLRAPRPPRPPPVADALADAHVRRVERVETEARAVVADAAHVDEIPVDAARNRAAGARLRGGR